MKTILVAVIIMVTPPFIGGADGGDWRTFTSEAGGFTVLLPETPTFTQSTDETIVGSVIVNLYRLEEKPVAFSAEFSDLPSVATFFVSNDTLYKDAKEDMLKEINGQEITFSKIEQDGVSGRELVYEVPTGATSPRSPLRGKTRFFLVGKRMYVLDGSAPKESKDGGQIDRYLDSFRLLKK